MVLQAVGLMVLGIFLANDSMASIDTRSMDGRIYVGDHKDTSISCGSLRFREKDFFPIISLYIYQSAQKPHATFPLPYLMMLYV